MKIAKEYVFLIIIGLFLLSYLLEAVVLPLDITLTTPYQYLTPNYLSQYPFTTATILLRSIAFFLTPLWILSFIKKHFAGKGAALLVISALVQLYALQEVITGTTLVPLEWSISLSFAGAALLVPAILFMFRGMLSSASTKLKGDYHESDETLEEKQDK